MPIGVAVLLFFLFTEYLAIKLLCKVDPIMFSVGLLGGG
jgi:hypothetical protein